MVIETEENRDGGYISVNALTEAILGGGTLRNSLGGYPTSLEFEARRNKGHDGIFWLSGTRRELKSFVMSLHCYSTL